MSKSDTEVGPAIQPLLKGEPVRIRYTKYGIEGQEVTDRTIIPTQLPFSNIRALDVSELTPEQRAEVADVYAVYQEYVDLQMSKIFNFETWLEHTDTKIPKFKWRMFRPEQTEVVND